jgi:hypothetical protein
MNTTETWIQQADNALRRAAKRAREVAALTNTPLLVQKEGKLVQLVMPSAGDLALREEASTYGEKKP